MLKEKNKIIAFCLLISFITMAICARSSFLYPMQNQVDPNCFLTVGKGMMNGKVMYKDLFEQKGPLLYFIHGIAYLISNHSFLGVYILEVLSFTVFLYFAHKLINLFLEDKYSYVILPLLTTLTLTSKAFKAGDSAEEFGLAFLAISLYYLIRYFHDEYPAFIGYKVILLNGIMAGCILWIKYTMLGFWFSWMMFIFITLILNKQYKKSIISCLVFLFGMLLTTIPWIIYFAINGALYDWINAYFIANIFLYSNPMSTVTRVLFIARALFNYMKGDYIFSLLVVSGLAYFICTKKYMKSILGKLALISCGFFLVLGVFGGGQARSYYFLIFYPFSILGFIVLFDFIRQKMDCKSWINRKVITIVVCVSILLTYILCPSIPFMKYEKEDLAQYKFAKIMNQTPNATLLNYGFLDGGFYFAADILPTNKYFARLNIPHAKFPIMMDEQNRIIKEKEVDYIVIQLESTQSIHDAEIPNLLNNYNFISKEPQYLVDSKYDYYLFQAN